MVSPFRSSHILPALATGFFVAFCAPAVAATVAVLPNFAAAMFTPGAPIDNRYFPLSPETRHTLEARGTAPDGEAISERNTLRYGGDGPVIAGVQTTMLIDRAYESGVLVEETFDFYAQDGDGNVWYMGEDVTNYVYDPAGNLISTNTESSWRAGVNGALPGYAMPADPVVGFAYYQEFAAVDSALDEGLIFGFLPSLDIGAMSFLDVLMVFETSALDPLLREIKYYAPRFGLIRAEEGVDADFRNPKLTQNIVAAVPLPATLPLLLAVLGGLGVLSRNRRRAL